MMDEKGQIAVDFLLGISLFLIALTFTVQFIPGMFMSGSAGESSLDYTAYRTATILAEDTGWWVNNTGSGSGTDWEAHTSDIKRIGLAVDDEPRSKLTNSPNILSKTKIEQFMLIDEDGIIEKLGLYNNVDGTLFAYGYNISIVSIENNGIPFVINGNATVRGSTAPDDQEIAKITRVVLVETGHAAVLNANELTDTINIKGPYEENVTIQIRNLNGTNPSFLNATLENVTLTQHSDFTITRKTGWTSSEVNGSIHINDIICLDFDHGLFNSSNTYRLDLSFSNVTLDPGPPFVSYNKRSTPLYEPAYMIVEVW
ncbi:MAG: hypothetical protein QCH31_07450 [Methanolobus sp.]|nr:hypothetical protein [Methanolobus sp.]